jgi:hypothetical protein
MLSVLRVVAEGGEDYGRLDRSSAQLHEQETDDSGLRFEENYVFLSDSFYFMYSCEMASSS